MKKNEQTGQFNSAIQMENINDFLLKYKLNIKQYQSIILKKINNDILEKSNNDFFNIEMYFHIPFCNSKCIYCPYTSFVTNDTKKVDTYVNALIMEFKNYMNNINNKHLLINSIYFGGGTPSILTLEQFEKIFMIILKYKYKFIDQFEFCIEFMPLDVYHNKFAYKLIKLINRMFKNVKIRFSIGVQTLDPNVNKIINRAHDIQEAKLAIEELYNLHVEFNNFGFNVDLMIGLPEQTEKSIIDDVKFMIEKKVPSISVDHTRILENTILFSIKDKFKYLSNEKVEEIKKYIYMTLKQNGYFPIGKGNFLTWYLPGYRRLYKAGNPNRIAFGASSISDFPNIRYADWDNMEKYIDSCLNNQLPHGYVKILDIKEQIYMNIREQLRINGTIDIQKINDIYKYDFEKEYCNIIKYLINNKYFIKEGKILKLTSGCDMFDVIVFFKNKINKKNLKCGTNKNE